ncbi:MAG: macro domain-containing protein [Dehalococcoidia bacterium]|nr:macro domain-containing protein [Dehalococcoidia bacterium]
MEESSDLELQIYGASTEMLPGNTMEVTIETSRGGITGLLHLAEGETGAAIWLGGASGDMNGPAGGLFAAMSRDLVDRAITSFRLRFRQPGVFQECVLDALGGVSFLKAMGATRIALIGHSFGGTVAISAGALSATVTAVAALSSPNAGTHLVSDLAPRPLLLIHGVDDFNVSKAASEEIYGRAGDPKKLVLLPGTGHDLSESRGDLDVLLREWLTAQVGSAGAEVVSSRAGIGTRMYPILVEASGRTIVKEAIIYKGDIADVEAEAIVCPANDQLWIGEGVGRSILARGGEEILVQAQYYAPAEIGSATVVDGGRLRAKYVIVAVTGASAWSRRRPDEDSVRQATINCLRRAEELRLKSMAFPALGTGAGGFAFEKAAQIMVKEVVEHLGRSSFLEKVIFAVYSSGAYQAFAGELEQCG